MEEVKKEDAHFESYSERLQKVTEEVQNAVPKKREGHIFKITQQEHEVAQAFLRLSENVDFKNYLQFENQEIGELCVKGFNSPAQGIMDGATFGEKMAFNKGRLFQMNYIRGRRDSIVKIYLELLKKQKGE